MPLRIRKTAWDKNTPSRLGSLPFQHSTRACARSHSREASPPPSCEEEMLENPSRGQGSLGARCTLLRWANSALPPASSAVGRAGAGEENASNWCRFWLGHVTRRRPGLALIFSCHSLKMFGVGEAETPPPGSPGLSIVFSLAATIKKKHLLSITSH